MESIPGYGLITQVVLSTTGIDVGDIVSLYLLLFGLFQGAHFAYSQGRAYWLAYGTAAVKIEDEDGLYKQFTAWISAQRMTEVSRDLKASSVRPRGGIKDADDENDILDEAGFFNYRKWASRKRVYYEPNIGADSFTHDDKHFTFTKGERENKYEKRFEKFITIRCRGCSTQPIKDLIAHVKNWSSKKATNMTEIYRAAKRDNYNAAHWDYQLSRPSRPMETVSLDEDQKQKILSDINEYLRPVTANWYAARGIPHRRGYLFHGPPGTGKTSLSFALAGIFGLNIFCASLCEHELKESDLARLFTWLPDRCIVLLEDIDSAGINREKSSDSSNTSDDSDSDSDSEAGDKIEDEQKRKKKKRQFIRRQFSRALRKQNEPKSQDAVRKKIVKKADEGKTSGISLAGLLNVIDGASSHEGRVLIMTTNCPEKLDSALIRPGRVDLQIRFSLATHEQIHAIFKRMYSTEHDVKAKNHVEGSGQATSQGGSSTACATCACTHNHNQRGSVNTITGLTPERLAELADQFVAQLPDITFSPAEIQGYLLMKKTDPVGAIVGVKEWKEKVLEAKMKGKKVMDGEQGKKSIDGDDKGKKVIDGE